MKHRSIVIAALLLSGTSALASAQSPSPSQAFAERVAELQALSSNSSQFQRDSALQRVDAAGEAAKARMSKRPTDAPHPPEKS